MLDAAGRPPGISGYYIDFPSALDPASTSLEKDAPLFLGVGMNRPFRIGLERYIRKHHAIACKYVGTNARSKPPLEARSAVSEMDEQGFH